MLLVEQRAQRTVALADRTYVLSQGRSADARARDADDTARMVEAYSREDSAERPHRLPAGRVDSQVQVDAIGLGVYALMAVGIGLVFGVLRLVNFAYGQLIMAGAYALAFATGDAGGEHPALLRGRPRAHAGDGARRLPAARGASPATMLVATFAIASCSRASRC